VHQFRPTEGTAPLPYENSIISHGKAAEIAGLSRVEFINALNQFKVSSFQYRTDEIVEEDTRR
jgi:predicted HTH domain antitoxin